nr:hypothetical protein [Nitrosomonas nitrosa]
MTSEDHEDLPEGPRSSGGRTRSTHKATLAAAAKRKRIRANDRAFVKTEADSNTVSLELADGFSLRSIAARLRPNGGISLAKLRSEFAFEIRFGADRIRSNLLKRRMQTATGGGGAKPPEAQRTAKDLHERFSHPVSHSSSLTPSPSAQDDQEFELILDLGSKLPNEKKG